MPGGRIDFLNITLDAIDEVFNPKVIIGCDVQLCPVCENPLSFSDGRQFCRNCQKNLKIKKHQFLRKVLQ